MWFGMTALPHGWSSGYSSPRPTGRSPTAPSPEPGPPAFAAETVLPPERVRSQLAAQRGGADTVFDDDGNRTGGARMTAVVDPEGPGQQGRHYRPTHRCRLCRGSSSPRTEWRTSWTNGRQKGGRDCALCRTSQRPQVEVLELGERSVSNDMGCSSGATCSRPGRRRHYWQAWGS